MRTVLRLGPVWLLLLIVLSGAGCTSPRLERQVRDKPIGPAYEPENLYAVSTLTPLVRTVAILPFGTSGLQHPFMPEVESTMIGKLRSSGRFHVILVSPDYLERYTGRHTYPYNEPLPQDLLEAVRSDFKADAVLLTEITAFRPYKPMLLGVRSRLIRLPGYRTLWACDEIFDAGDRTVSTGARKYAEHHLDQPYPLQSSYASLLSPQRFAGYVSQTLYESLPRRNP